MSFEGYVIYITSDVEMSERVCLGDDISAS